jgi:hypothetical protein
MSARSQFVRHDGKELVLVRFARSAAGARFLLRSLRGARLRQRVNVPWCSCRISVMWRVLSSRRPTNSS